MKNNQIKKDGLRYSEKKSITPFLGGTTLSCVSCGLFKLRKFGNFKIKFGGRWFYCFDCRPKKSCT